jgi:hypothetical protein
MNNAQVGFDIDTLDVDGPAITHKVAVIEDVDGNAITGFVLVGKNSTEFQAAANKIRIDNIKRAAKRKTQIDTSTDIGASTLARTVESNDRTLALSVIVGWFGFTSNGAEVGFEPQNLPKLFDKYPQWQVKVLAALDDEANFMTA